MPNTNSVDVIIIGAGLSGIDAAYHLQDQCPNKSYLILEGRDDMGGTWDFFRFPGTRSDSSMLTMAYGFRPWPHDKTLAEASTIKEYIKETAKEHNIESHIRFRHKLVGASWSSKEALWTLSVETTDKKTVQFTCNFLIGCSGYYKYDGGYTPAFAGKERFKGPIIHPNAWPQDLDYSNKRMVVIGSGATAVTLVPSLAKKASHVTMLQRSPGYMVSVPSVDRIYRFMRRVMPRKWAYMLNRWYQTLWVRWGYRSSRKNPEKAREWVLKEVRKALPAGYDVDTHFNPRYNVWDQRLCALMDGDMFQTISDGRAAVVTDEVDTFTETGIKLKSGKELPADIIVTATGFNMVYFGGVPVTVDGKPVDFANTMMYHGTMCADVPNFLTVFGYVNSTWTLRADMLATYACRIIKAMDAKQVRQVTPRVINGVRPQKELMKNFNPGYLQRAQGRWPTQGDAEPWITHQDVFEDRKIFVRDPVDDGHLEFKNP